MRDRSIVPDAKASCPERVSFRPGDPVLAFEAMAWGRSIASLALGSVFAAAACSSSSSSSPAPLGVGDDVHVDVDATAAPPQPNQNVPPDSPFAPVDGSSAYGAAYDANAVLTICASSASSDASDSVKPVAAQESGAPAAYDAGSAADAAASYGGDGGPSAACSPLPAACANEPDCECLFRVLAAEIPCSYPHCSVDKGYKVYCP